MKTLKMLQSGLLALLFTLAAGAHAQVSAQVPMYNGADRNQRLLNGAHAEGTLTVYTSMAEKDISRLVGPFEKKYGFKVKVWRAGTDKVLQRVMAEARSGHSEVDFYRAPRRRWKRCIAKNCCSRSIRRCKRI